MERIALSILILLAGCSSGIFKSDKSLDLYQSINLPPELYRLPLFSKNEEVSKNSSLLKCLDSSNEDHYLQLKDQFTKNNTNFTFNKQMGDCEAARGKFGEAFFYYDRALALTKNEVYKSAIYNNLAIIYFKKGFYPYAEFYFKKAETSDNSNPLSIYNLSLVMMRAGKYLENANMLTRKLGKMSDKSYWKKVIGLNFFLQGNMEQDIIKITKDIDDKSSELDFLKLAGSYYRWSNNPEVVDTNLDLIEQFDFQDPMWIDSKSVFIKRLKRVIAREKN